MWRGSGRRGSSVDAQARAGARGADPGRVRTGGPRARLAAAHRAPARRRPRRHAQRRQARARRARGGRAASPARSAAARSCATPRAPASARRASPDEAAGQACGQRWRAIRPPAATDFAPADVMTIRRLLEPQAHAAGGDVGDGPGLRARWSAAWPAATRPPATRSSRPGTWPCTGASSAAAHSPLLAALYGVVESARHGQVWGDLKRRSASSQRRDLYQEDHRAIVTALRARDADAAVEAMRTHLARVAGHLLGETR